MIISYIVAVGIIIGTADMLMGNRFGLGERFQFGFKLLGQMMISMAGVMAIAPALAALIQPVILPLFRTIGIDPSVMACVLANDMGGYQLAMSLAEDKQIAAMIGAVTSGMIGSTLVFNIPVGFSLIRDEIKPYFSQGLLVGICTVPIGSIVTGIILHIPFGKVLWNNLPVIILSAVISCGFLFFRQGMILFMGKVNKLMQWIGLLGVSIGCITYLTGIIIVPGMSDILETMTIVCGATITLLGMFPIIELIIKVFRKQILAIGSVVGLDPTSCIGVICTIATPTPVFGMLNDMNKKGIFINSAWIVSCTAMLGSQLGFIMKLAPEYLIPYLGGKITGGVTALILALLVVDKLIKE